MHIKELIRNCHGWLFLFLTIRVSSVKAQTSPLSFSIIAPFEIKRTVDRAYVLSRRYLQGVPGGLPDIQRIYLQNNSPREILDIFCDKIFPKKTNTILHLDIKDDPTATMSTDYLLNIADQLGYPMISWNPDYPGSLESSRNSRILQMAPTIYHQTEALLTLLSHYNWTHFVVIATSDVTYNDFITSVDDLVKKNNEYTGYPKKQQFYILSKMVFNVIANEDDEEETKRMELFLKNTPKDNRIFLLHSSSIKSKNMLDAAEAAGFTGSKYMWVLTASSIGIPLISTRMPLGLLGVTFHSHKIIPYEGRISTSTEFDDTITTVVRDSLRLWAGTMKNVAADPADKIDPGLLCNSTSSGRVFWKGGGTIYESMKSSKIIDRNSLIDFTESGMNKYVRLSIMNVGQITQKTGRRYITWQKVGQYSPLMSRGNVKSVVEMNDITWPGKNPFPPKGRPERRHFTIATASEEPYVMFRELDEETGKCNMPTVPCRVVYNQTLHGNDTSLENGTVIRCCTGLSIDLLQLLSQEMRFDYDLFEVPDRKFGVRDEITGQWNGLIRMLLDRKTDMVVTSLKITPKRAKDIEFSVPYLDTGIAIMVSFRDGEVSKTAVLEPYDSYAWALILIFSVHSIGAVIYIFEWLSPGGLNEGKISAKDNNFSLFRSFWLIWAMLFGAAVDTDNPRGIASRFMANIWALFALIFVASYTANLAAFMITKEQYYNLIGIEDWRLHRPGDHDPPFHFATIPGGSTQETIMETNRKMFEYMKRYNQPSVAEAIKALKKQEILAFIYDATPLYYQEGIAKDCNLKIVGNWYARSGYGIGFPRGSTELVDEMNHHILRLQEDGAVERLRKFWLAGACHVKRKVNQTSQQLLLLNFTSAFILLAAGIGYGILLLGFEHLYFRSGRKFVNEYDRCGILSLISLSMGRTMSLGQTVMEAIDFRKTHRCKDPLCETKLWNVKHELDLALLRLQKLKREKAIIEKKLKQPQ